MSDQEWFAHGPAIHCKDCEAERLTSYITTIEDNMDYAGKRIRKLEGAIRDNPCLVLVAQEVPYRDCFPLEPCEPCHCGKDLLAATEPECE